MKRIVSIIIALVLIVTAAFALAEDGITIGIGQFAVHGSLDNCRNGFLMGLAEAGIIADAQPFIDRLEAEGTVTIDNVTIIYQNSQADMGIAQTIAAQLAAESDMVVGIATPMAQALYNTADNKIPTIFTAVTDPVAAQFVSADGIPVGEITGTSDALPVAAQLATIRAMLPDATKIGILYTTSETNSVSSIEEYKALAPDYGFEIVESGISTINELELALANLVTKVDCISNLTDNTVVSGLQQEVAMAGEAGIPVFGSEVEQVVNGCIAAEGLDYIALGKQTGLMAAQVLSGEKLASEIPYEIITEPGLYVNSAVLEQFGVVLSDELAARAVEAVSTVE